eukprot:TRINITY_DN3824_c0_g1_i1.p1 TRINITY_DN3824_c0_g1~~TRINITY_DN3824_c0_g1_i1.p1  ORF type:complete len:409 (+),score=125.13 TRINITY_DN3824_c0_g1_i1:115-1341(+)
MFRSCAVRLWRPAPARGFAARGQPPACAVVPLRAAGAPPSAGGSLLIQPPTALAAAPLQLRVALPSDLACDGGNAAQAAAEGRAAAQERRACATAVAAVTGQNSTPVGDCTYDAWPSAADVAAAAPRQYWVRRAHRNYARHHNAHHCTNGHSASCAHNAQYRHLPTGLGGAHHAVDLTLPSHTPGQRLLLFAARVAMSLSAAALPTAARHTPLWTRRSSARVPRGIRSAARGFENWARRRVQLCGALSIGARYLVGDLGVQLLLSTAPFDPLRAASFAAFGLAYGAGPGYYVYARLYPWLGAHWFSRMPRLLKTIATLLVELLVHCPFIYFPAFYLTTDCLQKGITADNAWASLAKYHANFVRDWKMCIAVWGPLHFVNFILVPLHLRIPFMSVAGLLWTAVLSKARG